VYRLTRLSLSYPKITLLIVALITATLGVGLTRLRTEFGYRVLIGDDHPTIQALDSLIAQFGGGLPVRIAWECGEGKPCRSVFDRASLEMADAVARELSSTGEILNVLGPSNAPLLVPTTSGFEVRRFVENGEVVLGVEHLARRALEDSLWVGRFVSADGLVGVIVVQSADTRSDTFLWTVEIIESVLAPFDSQGFEFHLVGSPVDSVVSGRDLARSTSRLTPFTVLVIALVLLMLSRSWLHSVVTIGTMGLALAWTLGALGWLGWPRDSIHEVLAPLILVVGVCDAMHLLARHEAELGERRGTASQEARKAALIAAAGNVGAPCLITTLTTAGAFLSFSTSALDTFVRFGAIAAFGVLACLLLTFTLFPLLLQWLPPSGAGAQRATGAWKTALEAIVRTSARRRRAILVAAVAISLFCAVGWAKYLRVDNDWYENLGEQSRVIQSIRFVEDRLGPANTLEVEIALPPEAQVEHPETLRTVAKLSDSLGRVEGLGDTRSVLDLLSRLNRLLHNDDPSFERVGGTTAANAELLELVALADGSILNSWVSLDRSRLRISAEATQQSSSGRARILDSVERSVLPELPAGWSVLLSGLVAIDRGWVHDVQGTQVRSFPTALVLALVMVAFFLRSLRLALAAMVPTLLPVVVTLGMMGWVGMSLDVGRAMIAAVLIGIAVDDSIHLLHEYKQRRAAGDGPRDAIRGAVVHVGRAVVTTSLALSLGFLTLMASAWQTIASFGFFVSLAILGALAASLFVLPAIIFAFGRAE
jgi:predicted RND superfamily exporter protein